MDASVYSEALYSLPYTSLAMHMLRGLLSENKERDKTVPENVMEKDAKETFRAMKRLNQSWYETYQTVAQSTFDVQSRSVQYAQSVFKDGLETLKDHIESSQRWLQTANKRQGQEPVPSLIESGAEAYKRNIIFLQRTVEHGGETFRSNTDVMRDLTQTLIKKAEEQRDMLW